MNTIQNENKKGKIGTDGLTKKERRAQKVNAKITQNKKPIENESTSKEDISKAISQGVTENNKTDVEKDQPLNEIPEPLSEKELRRLEWIKKLEEQTASGDKTNEKSLSKAELKAKRREQQEAQRQQKTEQKAQPTTQILAVNESSNQETQQSLVVDKKEPKKPIIKKELKKPPEHKVQLVEHLYQEELQKLTNQYTNAVHHKIPPIFIKLGVQYGNKIILGSNARCLALLVTLKSLVKDLKSHPKKEFCRNLEAVLQDCVQYLQSCRPLSVSMTNFLRYFKLQLTQVDTNLEDSEKKAVLQEVIDMYIHNDIRKAGDSISMKVREKINNGDVILTFGCCSLITKILLEAHNDGKKFKVIVVDGRPLFEGRELLRRLVVAGIDCSYILINALSYVMGSVSIVLLGAHAYFTNGYVMSRIGTAQVALVARHFEKSVLVCCETYKFSERVQTDPFVYNELGNPDELIASHVDGTPTLLSKWKNISKLTPLSLLYDVTPADFVTAMVTEIAILPYTSVPVVLRIKARDTT